MRLLGILLSCFAITAAATTVNIPLQVTVTPTQVTIVVPGQTTVLPVPAAPIQPIPPTIPPAAGTSWGYYNGVFSWAGDYSYAATINYSSTATPAISGSKVIAVTLKSAWGAWQPYMASNWIYPTTGYTKLTFSLKPTVANQKWNVFFIGVGDVPLAPGCGKNVLSYGPAPVVGQWATYTVPLADLCVLNQNVYKFDIQDQTGLSANVWYIDNVGFAP